jgi:hypothetical protein
VRADRQESADLNEKPFEIEGQVRRVFVLGAGASCPYGLPTLKRLFWEVLQVVAPEERAILLQAAYEACNVDVKCPEDGPDFELLISRLDTRSVFLLRPETDGPPERQDPSTEMVDAAGIALRALRQFILLRCRDAESQRGPYDALVAMLNPDDAIVSFNWDVLLELAFLRANRTYAYIARDPSQATLLLKPHGSINWLPIVDHHLPMLDTENTELVGGTLEYCMTYLPRPLESLDSGPRAGLAQYFMGRTPAIVPPRPTMELSLGEAVDNGWAQWGHQKCMRHVWAAFKQAVLQAEKLVIVGYSLPGSDMASVEVMKCFGQGKGTHRVSVVDPQPTVLERYRRIVHPGAEKIANGFEDLTFAEL